MLISWTNEKDHVVLQALFYLISVTATDTASTNKIRNSPPVKMKLHNVLNSTAYKGKDCLGTIEFPSSISPISQKTGNYCCFFYLIPVCTSVPSYHWTVMLVKIIVKP